MYEMITYYSAILESHDYIIYEGNNTKNYQAISIHNNFCKEPFFKFKSLTGNLYDVTNFLLQVVLTVK